MLNIQIDNNNDYICDLSYTNSYYTQNNNKIDPSNTCATTSMIQALDLSGYSSLFPKGNYDQAEDNLTYFIRNDSRVLDYYKKIDYYNYSNWITSPSGVNVYPPNEIHQVLSYGTNLWIGKQVTQFTTNFSINDIPSQILIKNRPLVMSGVFHKLNHVITCIGITVKKESFELKEPKDIGFFDCTNFIFNDSFGYTWDYTQNRNGEKVRFTPNQVIMLLKSKDNPTEKWVHLFN